MRRTVSTATFLLAFAFSADPIARAQAHDRPPALAVRDVRLSLAEDAPRHTVVARDGRIAAVLDLAAELPPDARVIEGGGAAALPAFLDAFSAAGCVPPAPETDRDRAPSAGADALAEMRAANRKGLQPSFEAARALKLEDKDRTDWRERGFGALLSAPGNGLLAGTSALAALRVAAARDAIVAPSVFMHGAFRADGPGYPSTSMGYLAQLRQFLLDAAHYAELRQRYEERRPGVRPPWDADLEAAGPLLARELALMAEADSLGAIERWLRLSDEFQLQLAIAGGRDAWRCTEALVQRNVPVVLTLDWGEEAKDPAKKDEKKEGEKKEEGKKEGEKEGEKKEEAEPEPSGAQAPAAGAKESLLEYKEPLGVAQEKRRRWEERRNGALVLLDAGVRFAFGTGSRKPGDLIKGVRQLVEAGLSRDEALAALTTSAAEILGVERQLGKIEVGFDASFALWPADPFGKDAKPSWVFVDGWPYELEREEEEDKSPPEKGLSASGTWKVTATGGNQEPVEYELVLEMAEDGAVTGKASFQTPNSPERQTPEVKGRLAGRTLRLRGSYTRGETEVEFRFKLELQKDQAEGDLTTSGRFGERKRTVSGSRVPGATGATGATGTTGATGAAGAERGEVRR